MMNEIHPAVEAANVQKRRAFTEKNQAASAYKKATRALLIRAWFVAALVAGCWLALIFDLVAWQIALPFEILAVVWLAFWAGAWVQFRFCKGGLLE